MFNVVDNSTFLELNIVGLFVHLKDSKFPSYRPWNIFYIYPQKFPTFCKHIDHIIKKKALLTNAHLY